MAYDPIPQSAEDAAHVAGEMLVRIGGVRRDSDTTPVDADGDWHTLTFNQFGRLKVSAQPAAIDATVGNITASGQSVSADVARASNVMMYVTGTFAGHNATFEGSIDGGVTWFGIQAARTNANTIETATGVLAAAPVYAWEMSVNGMTNVRVRATAHTSGTAVWRILPGVYATEPIPAISTHPVTITDHVPGTSAARLGKAEDAVHATGDTGVMMLGVRNDNGATAPTSANGDYSFIAVDAAGRPIMVSKAPTAVLTQPASSITTGVILAANIARQGAVIVNDSTATLYLAYAATATTTAFSYKLAAGQTHEVPFGYTGVISGIWDAANGAARVTEIT